MEDDVLATQNLAYDYPVLGAFWTLLWIFLCAIWLVLVFRVAVDIFRDQETSGWAKAGWLLFVLVLPFIGIFSYLVVNGQAMADRNARKLSEQRGMVDAYIRQAAGTGSAADDLAALSGMRAKGDITAAEFERAKEKILR
jgi:hypothetical protein